MTGADWSKLFDPGAVLGVHTIVPFVVDKGAGNMQIWSKR